ncbi:hypothetical protein QCA50_003979 [Cerrena zonata]|uniref:Uncharacterized protein n=1 Tax=Cerrena zonata TaxID=2478898 RepID=A0AAW0GKM7_9APHY
MTGGTDNWDGEVEMQKLLDMLPGVQPESSNADTDLPSALDHLEMCGWDMGQYLQTPSSTMVGVF